MKGDRQENWAALLGSPGTKRTKYWEHAAAEAGLHVLFIDWEEWKEGFWENWFFTHGGKGIIKIDPPRWNSGKLEDMPHLMGEYQKHLQELERLGAVYGVKFFNPPEVIAALLDKRACKAKLRQAGVPVTEDLGSRAVMAGEHKWERNAAVVSGEALLEWMKAEQVFQVFIKPVFGSGAAGVTAFRYQPRTGQMVLYTCAAEEEVSHKLINTKRLYRLFQPGQILAFLDRLLVLDCVVERWYAKAEYHGFTYDLRAVVQDGQVDFLLARLSKGPITNLHLNNHPLPINELGLSPAVFTEIETLSQQAVSCYPGLKSTGMDILLEKGSLRPRVIEMNGQGDLLYQDIYHKNRIYAHQIEMMKQLLTQ